MGNSIAPAVRPSMESDLSLCSPSSLTEPSPVNRVFINPTFFKMGAGFKPIFETGGGESSSSSSSSSSYPSLSTFIFKAFYETCADTPTKEIS